MNNLIRFSDQAMRYLLTLAPMIFTFYLLFRLDTDQWWTLHTPLRDVATILILITGLLCSLYLSTRFLTKT